MEAAPISTAAMAGPSSEGTMPGAHDEDTRRGHSATITSQVSKPTASLPPTTSPNAVLELGVKDMKSTGTRSNDGCHESEGVGLRVRQSRLCKDAGPVEQEKKKPLQLLDLPVDVLKDIVKEVTHTNDLTSLAICHSALNRLAIPHIYSRFDIVWPDINAQADSRSGVDALTYGLATLVMAEEIFGEAPDQRRLGQTNRFSPSGHGRATEPAIRRRRGNHYARFTKKFSLGNGPADWVEDYLVNKEAGKMLGTLVALAIARMRSLETFVWDMPTGILRDVWLALSSLGDRHDEKPCRLEKVWVRWHNNVANPLPTRPPLNTMPPKLHSSCLGVPSPNICPVALDRVEHPSFSGLPPLKSLSVLDIDELAYLDEMAILVGRSLEKLKELRVGIARHALTKDWVTVWEGGNLQQVDPSYPTIGSLTIGEKRLGGVLGILTGFVCDMRQPEVDSPKGIRHRRMSSSRSQLDNVDNEVPPTLRGIDENATACEGFTSLRDVILDSSGLAPESIVAFSCALSESGNMIVPGASPTESNIWETVERVIPSGLIDEPTASYTEGQTGPWAMVDGQPSRLNGMLQLESLELERVALSIPVLQKTIDWSLLSSLTLLHCPNHEQLWKTLRRTFTPTPRYPTHPSPRRTSSYSSRKGGKATFTTGEPDLQYRLNLKKVHTNTVSPALISFLKETLAPNSLEVLFLQEARSYSPSVQIDAIFRGPLRRHRSSLKKLLIDSSEKNDDGLHTSSSKWRKWLMNRDILGFICGGKMPSLRELGIAIDYRDWHFFLQRLPSVPHLRSLYLPFLADHVHGTNVDPRELALQIVDIVALRPEVELCYVGISNKCFEILEKRRAWDNGSESALSIITGGNTTPEIQASEDGDDDEDNDDDGDAEDEEDDDEEEEEENDDEDDEDYNTESDDDEGERYASDEDSDGKNTAHLRLREILFYDDKVSVFKVRHGRL